LLYQNNLTPYCLKLESSLAIAISCTNA
jgi:hypothetical protein